MNLAALLQRAGRADFNRPALVLGTDVTATYGALARDAAVLGRALRETLGLGAGDRVAIVMRNVPDYVTVLFGAWWGGLSVVPANAKLHPKEIDYILRDSGARVCFVTPDLAPSVEGTSAVADGQVRVIEAGSADWRVLLETEPLDEPLTVEADAMAWLFYTSGTTGRPKGAMLSHRNLFSMTACYFADVDAIGAGDCIVHAAPMSHGSGLYILPHVAQAAAQVIPESGGFDPAEIFALMRAHRGLSMFAAPTMVHRLNVTAEQADPDTGNLKSIIYGGGPMYLADCKRAFALFGPKLIQIYGQGESPMTITALSRARHAEAIARGDDALLGSVGVAQMLADVRVTDEGGTPLPAGETGEVVVRGPQVMPGYWRQPDATAATIRDGWLHTGDMGAMAADGCLTLKDRSKDVIISGGTNIYPREVEEALLLHPAVREVSVIGRPVADWGEEVVAFVVPRPGATVGAADLDGHVRDHIARFKRPRHYRFLEALPKNHYGKVAKITLREWLDKETEPAPPPT
ncbi:class I adenylate-forming enzyme family protein [Oceanibacterium hippocampi]|uniref:Long-chain-fatty-acid--CoA ligase n=1 Tax=Oceanibacterium hippocampi TaxID=745714 RepID=A0A1Y5TY27_9PROT|nr:AMP-binding protein [Oceanibacterium hippocampi]SLN76646.1 Long-chain-fatty-acid--CoA ligase [Oceanibacterium hippocampi]